MASKKIVAVIGGGAAGMMASFAAAQEGCHVILLEKNVRLGRKMLITGKGRCNITNECTVPQLVKSMVGNGKFLYSAFSNFSAEDTMNWFQNGGVPLKTERGQRVFPESDRSSDIVSFMERKLRKAGVDVRFHAEVKEICVTDGAVSGVRTEGKVIPAAAVILATGGVSYPLTGSTGDGYKMAEALDHQINPCFPALVPLVVKEDWVQDLEGLSLRNAEVTIQRGQKILGREFGEMVFTNFGLSGPVILTLSRLCGAHFLKNPKEPLGLSINLKPALTEEQLDSRLLRDFDTYPKRNYRTLLEGLLPKKLIPVFVILSGIDPWKQGHQLNREDRKTIRR
ncbi:MAG: aminoacetone oxidase family FAD-binding enzyme, partial [Bacillota bacterium]|nr:aminoacetone oxidase family FAD-binding enzyme [Bacillota bacterium]